MLKLKIISKIQKLKLIAFNKFHILDILERLICEFHEVKVKLILLFLITLKAGGSPTGGIIPDKILLTIKKIMFLGSY